MAAALYSGGGGGGGGEEYVEIYVRTMMTEHGYHWFRLNTGTTKENVPINPNIPPPKSRFMSSIAAVGSTVYDIGGSPDPFYSYLSCGRVYADVYSLDTTALRHGTAWKKATPMAQKRKRPYPVPLHDGRLLVIGGTDECRDLSPFAEIYDPTTLTWTPSKAIPEPDTIPFTFHGHTILGNKVFLYSGGDTSLCCYDIQQDYWEVCSTDVGSSLGSSALIDGILYIIDYDGLTNDQFLFGYDFENFNSLASSTQTKNKEKMQNPFALSTQMPVEILPDYGNKDTATTEWLPRRNEDSSFPKVFLWALGNDKLAMVWSLNYPNADRGSVAIHVSVFQMTKMNSGNDSPKNVVATARHLYQRRYPVQGFRLLDCVAVSFSSRKAEAHKDLPNGNNIDNNRHNMKQLDEKKRVGKKKPNKKKLHHK